MELIYIVALVVSLITLIYIDKKLKQEQITIKNYIEIQKQKEKYVVSQLQRIAKRTTDSYCEEVARQTATKLLGTEFTSKTIDFNEAFKIIKETK